MNFSSALIKMWIAVWLVYHAFEFQWRRVADVAQHIVNKAAGVVNTSATVSEIEIVAMMDTLKEKWALEGASRLSLKLTHKGYT